MANMKTPAESAVQSFARSLSKTGFHGLALSFYRPRPLPSAWSTAGKGRKRALAGAGSGPLTDNCGYAMEGGERGQPDAGFRGWPSRVLYARRELPVRWAPWPIRSSSMRTSGPVIRGRPKAEAVALRGDRILAEPVRIAEVKRAASRGAETIDAEGALVLPGFTDSAVHWPQDQPSRPDLREAASKEESSSPASRPGSGSCRGDGFHDVDNRTQACRNALPNGSTPSPRTILVCSTG